MAILFVVCGVFALSWLEGQLREESPPPEKVAIMDAQLQGKLFFFARQIGPENTSVKDLGSMNTGSVQQRLAYAILIADVDRVQTGLDALSELDRAVSREDYTMTETQTRLRKITEEVLLARQAAPDEFTADTVSDSDREFLLEHLGWFGRLAVTPVTVSPVALRQAVVDEAYRFGVTIVLLGLALLAFIGLGFIVAGITAVLYFQNRLKVGTPDRVGGSTVYLETFALWMVVFWGAQVAIGLLVGWLGQAGEGLPAEGGGAEFSMLLLTPVIFFGSLLVLFWPVARGIPFSRVCDDIGWRLKNPVWEGLQGMMGYLASVPLLGIGVIGTVIVAIVVAVIFPADSGLAGSDQVIHPVQEWIGSGKVSLIAMTFFVACICAPIVEETVFRGLFYRYLKDRTAVWPRAVSVLFSAFVNGMIFAVIHPQGIVGVPVLISLATALSLIRQWRGTLVAPIAVHAFHNAFAVTASLLVMS